MTIDYLAAKQEELYAGIPVDALAPTAPFILQVIARSDQPLVLESATIHDERWPRGPNGYPLQPGPSPTWEAAYEAFKRGEQLALPYLEQRAVDTAKQSEPAHAYQRYRAGEIEADELPELADIFPDDPQVRARIGLQTEPDATPEDALIQACGPCHSDVLDQTISRARFTIAVVGADSCRTRHRDRSHPACAKRAGRLACVQCERPHRAPARPRARRSDPRPGDAQRACARANRMRAGIRDTPRVPMSSAKPAAACASEWTKLD